MKYENIKKGIFLERPNRFIALVAVDGTAEVCHVKNTGRCRELLISGSTVYVQECKSPKRKTKYDLISVEKVRENDTLLINMDANAPNKVFHEWAKSGKFIENLKLLKPEKTYGKSRLDFYYEKEDGTCGFVEVKGVTLEHDNVASFPDAPTLRGIKHIEELIEIKNAGYEASICFVIQMEGMKEFRPNDITHKDFGDALRKAQKAGLNILALSCKVSEDSLAIDGEVKIVL